MVNIAVFASGSGTNAVNLVNSFNGGNRIRVAICLVDRQSAPVIEKMERLGVAVAYYPRKTWREQPEVILDVLRDNDIQVIALAGFLSIVNSEIVRAYEGRILNIHPSLLPAFGGDGMWGGNVHQAVLDAGVDHSGATVHIVTEEVDKGPILLQKQVPVLPGDTAETLEMRVHEAEYEIFPQAVIKLVKNLGEGSQTLRQPVEQTVAHDSVDDQWAQVLGVQNNVSETRQETQPAQPEQTWHRNMFYQQARQQQQNATATAEPMPKTHIVWSVLTTIIFSFIPGIIAIINSARVSTAYYSGDIEGAKRASRRAEIWIIVSFVLGVLSNTLYVPLAIAGLL